MSNLPETSNFDDGVYELQTTDLVLGGPSGPANNAAANLTNRTRWLFDQNAVNVAELGVHAGQLGSLNGSVISLNGSVTAINAHLATLDGEVVQLAPIANPSLTGVPKAPTAAAGTVSTQIATTAFVNAAINAGSFLGGNGFIKFPGGLIFQWGLCSPNGGFLTVNLPTAFPNAPFAANCTGTSQPTTSNVTGLSQTQITIKNSGGQSYFMAVGN